VSGAPKEEDLRRSVTDARVARLATVRPDGRPHVVPICFALEGETLYTAVDRKPKRSRNLKRLANVRAHPDVEVLVDHYEDDWEKLWWVRLHGRGRVLEAGLEHDHALALLVAKYRQYRKQPPPGPVLAIDLDGWRGWHA
jgi:PPOX class probable F420-dependent enzyme